MGKVVKVIDSLMGSGKTTWAINMMNAADSDKRFIFVTPFLDEVNRIITSVTNRQFMQPNYSSGGRKLNSLKRLLERGENVATTHSLFSQLDDEALALIADNEYTLVLDEIVTPFVITHFEMSDIRTLLEVEYIRIDDESGKIIWTDERKLYEQGRYSDIKKAAQAGTLYFLADNYLVNAIDSRLFTAFKECFVMTYMFDCSLLRYYFDINTIDYEIMSINDGELVPHYIEDRRKYRELIRIYDGDYNDMGNEKSSFCRSWLDRQSHSEIKGIKNKLYSYVKHQAKAKSDEVIWTCLKDYKPKLEGKGFTKGYLPVNARATNKYGDRNVVMYCYSRYLSPYELQFFYKNNVNIDDDKLNKLALSDMLQFIWRSAIRRGNPINVYVPSKRMRTLLMQWLNGEI